MADGTVCVPGKEGKDGVNDLISRGIENALAILDAVYSSGRMDYYSDYCALHDAISSIEVPSEQPEKVCIANITLSEEQIREVVEKAKNEVVQVLPSAQPKIIRCKDCRWRKDQSGSTAWMPCREIVTPSDFYCGRAERRTGEA